MTGSRRSRSRTSACGAFQPSSASRPRPIVGSRSRRRTSAIEQALQIASGPLERITALEWVGTIARSDYQGDVSWRSFKEAIDLRLQHAPDDRKAIAWACVNGLENPLRWPGSMKAFPEIDEVKRLPRDLCRPRRGRARARRGSVCSPRERSSRSGSEPGPTSSPPTARRRSPPACAPQSWPVSSDGWTWSRPRSMGRGSAIITLGHYGRLRDMLTRRVEIAEQIEDPWEAGDAYAMVAWNGAMLGDFEASVLSGLLGRDRGEAQAAGIVDHCLNWAGTSFFQPRGVGSAARGLP